MGLGARRPPRAPQGRLGTALLTHSFAEFQRRGRLRAGLGSTPRARRGRSDSTSARGCASSGAGTSGNAGRERAPRPLPVLPDADGCGVRRRLRVPQLRRLVRGRSGPCPAGLGEGRRGDGGSGAHGACLARGAGGRARLARGAVERGRTRAAKASARARRMLLRPCGRDTGARRPPRASRCDLARRARRSQHPADLAVGGPLGHASPDGDRRGECERGRRRARRRP